MSVPLVESGLALESMRNSDFDVYSAYGEVIDNSIQANAKVVRVWIDYVPAATRRASERINYVAFSDDGDGMDAGVLHQCLQLGYSSRYNDRGGIGRFGVGATLAAINQAKKIEVYSRQSAKGQWLSTFVDLDKIKQKQQTGIPAPEKGELPSNYNDLVSAGSGTLVVWSKYDRQPATASEIKDEFVIWAGRTYRKKIWDGLQIYVNNELVPAIDPLYANTKNTQFPKDPPALEYTPVEIDWPIPAEDQTGKRKSSKIVVRISLLPKEFRANQGTGNSKNAKDRCIDRNEGVSILRNDREVFYGHIPYWPGDAFREIDRWWGCEISFHAELDREFTVKNIKRGAVPTKELKEALAAVIAPTRNTALEAVRELWAQARAEEQKKSKTEGVDTGHSDAENAAKNTPTPKSNIDKEKDVEQEAQKLAEELHQHADDQKRAAWQAKFQSQPFTIVDDQWRGPEFFETHFLGGKSVLKYNKRHVFFAEIDNVRKALGKDIDSNPEARRLKALVDLLLIAYAKSEAMFEAKSQMTPERFIEQLRMNWGNYLSNYIDTFKNENPTSGSE